MLDEEAAGFAGLDAGLEGEGEGEGGGAGEITG